MKREEAQNNGNRAGEREQARVDRHRRLAYDHARNEANAERRALIAARKLWREDPERSDDTPQECEAQYAATARARTLARQRMLHQIKRYRAWLIEVNGGVA